LEEKLDEKIKATLTQFSMHFSISFAILKGLVITLIGKLLIKEEGSFIISSDNLAGLVKILFFQSEKREK